MRTSTAPDPSSPSPVPAPAQADGTTRWSRALALACTVGLIVLGLAWELWLSPTGSGTLAVKVLPLLLPLPGLWRYRMVTYRWLSLLVWLYVCEGALRATSEGGLSQWLAAIELVLALALFVACSIHVRARLARARATSPA